MPRDWPIPPNRRESTGSEVTKSAIRDARTRAHHTTRSPDWRCTSGSEAGARREAGLKGWPAWPGPVVIDGADVSGGGRQEGAEHRRGGAEQRSPATGVPVLTKLLHPFAASAPFSSPSSASRSSSARLCSRQKGSVCFQGSRAVALHPVGQPCRRCVRLLARRASSAQERDTYLSDAAETPARRQQGEERAGTKWIHEHAVTLRRATDSTAAGGVVRDDTPAPGCRRGCATRGHLAEVVESRSPRARVDASPRQGAAGGACEDCVQLRPVAPVLVSSARDRSLC